MERTLISKTISLVGKEICIKGWVNSVRAHGQLVFVDLRDRTGVIQCVGNKELKQLKDEYIVNVVGIVKDRDPKLYNEKVATGKIELEVKSFEIISVCRDLPFDVHQPDLKVTLPVALDYRPASLRHQKVRDTFKVQATICRAFRDYLDSDGFTEFHAPTIVAGATEGGSQVFPVDYFGYKSFLAQSPQLYKQVMVSVFDRVYTLAHAYRAEPSVTTRHLTEYVGLDVEMGFIDSWLDVVKTADSVVKAIFKMVEEKHKDILDEFGVTVPKTIKDTPMVKLSEALNIVYERTGRDVRQEPDMDPESEREICRWAYEKYGSEMVFITHFYTKKRAWYSYPDPSNPEETLTFDLIGRGVEWISGGQRINDYDQLVGRIKDKGMDPSAFDTYIQSFKYGMPPEGGFAIGLERITQNILGLDNIRQSTIFPRDMERIDGRLSVIGQKITGNKVDLHQKLINLLKDNSIEFQHLEHEETNTSQDSARVRGTTLEQGAKALVMYADKSPILVVLSASSKLDNSSFKTQFDVKDLRMASPEEVVKVSSAVIGAVPPFGNLFNTPTFVDQALLKQEKIAFNAGSKTKSVIMKSSDFVKLVNPKIGQFSV